MERLQRDYPGRFPDVQLRTLQRRVREWRHVMARSLPLVVSPLRTVLEREGVEVVLVSVEAWPDEVVVRARSLPSERTALARAQRGRVDASVLGSSTRKQSSKLAASTHASSAKSGT